MIVYRYATEKELELVLKGKNLDVGSTHVNKKCNTHKYNKKKRYLHFFKLKESIQEIQFIRENDKQTYYLCEYDIPMLILMLGRGVGYYRPHGYNGETSSHIEYIVSNDMFKSCWLKSYVLDENKNEYDVKMDN